MYNPSSLRLELMGADPLPRPKYLNYDSYKKEPFLYIFYIQNNHMKRYEKSHIQADNKMIKKK